MNELTIETEMKEVRVCYLNEMCWSFLPRIHFVKSDDPNSQQQSF